MPFIEGESLRDRLRREKQLPIADAVRIATEIAGALDYAHRHDVIHRDIKPENILLHDGRALVADFGIALAASKAGGGRMTETGMSLGTPHYMSPEQAMGEREITARSRRLRARLRDRTRCWSASRRSPGRTAQAIVAKVMSAEPRQAHAVSARRIPPARRSCRVHRAREDPGRSVRHRSGVRRGAGERTRSREMRTAAQPVARLPRSGPGMPVAVGRGPWRCSPGCCGGPSHGSARGRRRADGAGDARPGRQRRDPAERQHPVRRSLRRAGAWRSSAMTVRTAALWVRDLDQPSARKLPDTRGAFAPFFSPDGESIGFFTSAAAPTATASSASSAPAAWPRCTSPTTSSTTARSRSRCCGRSWPRSSAPSGF